MAMEDPRDGVQEQTCMRTEAVRLATDNVLTLRPLEPASVNLPLPLDRSLGDDLPRCPLSRALIFSVTQRTTSSACRYLLQFLDGF